MYYWRVFLWTEGHKSTEFSDNVIAPIFLEDKLDETLDTGEIILKDMPISTRTPFPPKTKFRLERYLTIDYSDTPKTWDMVVEHDDVEEYEGCPEICTHRIHLIEASVVAQGIHVDNIALTYELQDVTLNYRTIRESTTTIGNASNQQPGGYNTGVRQTERLSTELSNTEFLSSVSFFRNSYRYVWDNTSLYSIKNLLRNLSAESTHIISFTVPKLLCQGATGTGAWNDTAITLFEMNTVTRVREIKTFNGQQIQSNIIATKYSGASELKVADDERYYSNGVTAALRSINDYSAKDYAANQFDRLHSTHSVVATANGNYNDKTITFTTKQLTTAEVIEGWAYTYTIECYANPTNSDGMIKNYEKQARCTSAPYIIPGNPPITGWNFQCDITTNKNEIEAATNVYVAASFQCLDMSQEAEGGMFLMKGTKYSCFDLLNKAMLTTDTQIIDNSVEGIADLSELYAIKLSSEWETRLKAAKMQETIFEVKNLWEVFLQIGYYLHAIPYLEFAHDGTDRFVLKFKQLGDTKKKTDASSKITVFNSLNLSEFFTQYDSYVTNLFSPQNIVEEWLVPKTKDSSYLISNDTAELQASRPITEILKFDIIYDGSAGGKAGKADALQYIFEESIYQILTSDNPMKIKPAKGNAICYKLGTNIINGLNYVPPQKNNGTYYYSLQEICRRLFGTGTFRPSELKFNNLLFHIKYRTQDELRISQIRPDLQNFMKNSAYEKYPHHEQYYGQQDKIIDSERFSANLFGKLIRVGNTVYQRQEYATATSEKESGDLVDINGESYYVTATENEYYPDVIFQKVTYSKNFNQLSNIVTIPSEPRFYEVSERSKIRREIRIMDFFELSTMPPKTATVPRFLSSEKWQVFLKHFIFNKLTEDEEKIAIMPNYAYTKFVADHTRNHTGSYGQYVPCEQLFPSSEINRADPDNVIPKEAKDNADCIVPLLHFPLHDGIVFEWDMEDNFKVGDCVDIDISGINEKGNAYFAQQSHRYVDIMGRADLFTFKLFYKCEWTREEARCLPKAATIPSDKESIVFLPQPYSIALDKDNREAISFNYQINLLHRPTETEKEDFFTFPNLFGQKESSLKMCFLTEPQSLFNENVNLSPAKILADNVDYQLVKNETLNAIEVQINAPIGMDKSKLKAIVLYQENEIGERYAYIIKNVTKLPDSKKLQSWWIYPVYNC